MFVALAGEEVTSKYDIVIRYISHSLVNARNLLFRIKDCDGNHDGQAAPPAVVSMNCGVIQFTHIDDPLQRLSFRRITLCRSKTIWYGW